MPAPADLLGESYIAPSAAQLTELNAEYAALPSPARPSDGVYIEIRIRHSDNP